MKDTLIPALRPGDILIWDNPSAHHSKKVPGPLKEASIELPFVPTQSRQGPIEMMWNKMKGVLRKLRIRGGEKNLVVDTTAKECAERFKKR